MRHSPWYSTAMLVLLGGCGGGSATEVFKSEAGNFEAQLSGTLKNTEQTQKTPAGEIKTLSVESVAKDKTSRSVSYTDLPASLFQAKSPDAVLDAGVQGMTQQWLISNRNTVNLSGHPGREVKFAMAAGAENGAGLCRVFLVGHRLYQVVIVGPEKKISEFAMKSFLDSFKLLQDVPIVANSGPPQLASAPSANPQSQRSPAVSAQPKQQVGSPNAPTAPSEPKDLGAKMVEFNWLDENSDIVGGHGDATKPNGAKDHHFKLKLDLPSDATIEEMTLTSGGSSKWVTKPTPGLWPIAVHQGEKALTTTHADRIGAFSGEIELDLYANSPGGMGPGTAFKLVVVVKVGDAAQTLIAEAKRQ